MVIVKRILKMFGFVCLSPFLMVAMVLSLLSIPFVYLTTGEADMFDFFGKTIDLLGI